MQTRSRAVERGCVRDVGLAAGDQYRIIGRRQGGRQDQTDLVLFPRLLRLPRRGTLRNERLQASQEAKHAGMR